MTPSLPQRNADRDDFIVQGRVDHVCSWRDSFMCVEDSFICDIWLIHVCDVTHSFLRLDLLVCETLNVYVWLIDVRDMTHSYVWHDSFTCVTWLIRFWDTTYTACVTWRIRSTHPSRWCKFTHFWTWLTHVRDMTNSCVTWLIHVCEMTFSFFLIKRSHVQSTFSDDSISVPHMHERGGWRQSKRSRGGS